jgi:hypothetical protein
MEGLALCPFEQDIGLLSGKRPHLRTLGTRNLNNIGRVSRQKFEPDRVT